MYVLFFCHKLHGCVMLVLSAISDALLVLVYNNLAFLEMEINVFEEQRKKCEH